MDFHDADTCVVSFREARRMIEEFGAGDVVAADPESIAALWKELHVDRARLATGTSSRDWLHTHADLDGLSQTYSLLCALTQGRTA